MTEVAVHGQESGVHDEIILEWDTEHRTCSVVGGSVPNRVGWLPELLNVLRRGTSEFASFDGRTVRLDVEHDGDGPIFYRLTGEYDLTGALVSKRVTADGREWR